MSTEHKDPADPQGGAPEPVTYTDAQQAHLQTLINAAVGRATAKVRTELETKVTTLTAELETAKATQSTSPSKENGDDVAQIRAQLAEALRYQAESKTQVEQFKSIAQERERDAAAAEASARETLKEVAIQRAISKIPFYDANTVIALTKSDIVWDVDRKTFVVKGEGGQTRLDNTLEKPLSLDLYFNEYAAKNKYLVRAEALPGTGSSESTRPGLSKTGRYEVADVFGPKSDARKASELMKQDPQEYRRMKAMARDAGLIA